MTTIRSDGGGAVRRQGETPGTTTTLLILTLVLLLIGFSIGAALLGQASLAAIAGTGAVGVTSEIVRRVLSSSARTSEPTSSSLSEPEQPDVR